jgi:hypothetical protein
MQPEPVHGRGHQAPDRTPRALLPRFSRAVVKAVLVGALAFAGWSVLSAMAGPHASADTHDDPGDSALPLDGTAQHLDDLIGLSDAPQPKPGPQSEPRPEPRPAETGRAHRTEPDTPQTEPGTRKTRPDVVTDLISTVSAQDGDDRGLLPKTRSALLRKDGLAGPSTTGRLLSTLTLRGSADTLLGPALGPHLGSDLGSAWEALPFPAAEGDSVGDVPPDAAGSGRTTAPGTGDARHAAPRASACHDCAGHGPSTPQQQTPSTQDPSGAFPHTGQSPGAVAGMPPALIDTAPSARNARAFPATELKDDSAPARPMVVPD